MNQLVPLSRSAIPQLPALVTATGERSGIRFLEFFPPRSATRTPAAPMREPWATS
jgi:hypothetical protein